VKVRRYIAPDMRSALVQVRAEQGPDVVILSNRKVEGGIELITAEEYDEAALAQLGNRKERNSTRAEPVPAASAATEAVAAPVAAPAERPKTGPELLWTREPLLDEVRTEMRSLRRMVEHELSVLSFSGYTRSTPLRQSLARKLRALGITRNLTRSIVEELGHDVDAASAWRLAIAKLCKRIPIHAPLAADEPQLVAFIGATGVGKTTVIAKLAIRHALRYGKSNVALITTDSRRIGAFDQLRAFGSLIGLPVWTVGDKAELSMAISATDDKSLVLIDTAGVGIHDRDARESLNMLIGCHPRLTTYAVVSANSQATGLAAMRSAYAAFNLSACVITKLDEAASLGPVISDVIEQDMPVVYTSSGQRIPEDLDEARAHALVSNAISVAKRHMDLDRSFAAAALDDDFDAVTG
jgi:flagellar biosynthesis protein FlhF